MAANVELVRRAFEAFADRDLDAALEVFDPECEFMPVTAKLVSAGVPYHGHEGIARYLEDVESVWHMLRVTPEEFRVDGDVVVTLGRVHARGAGMVIDRPAGWVWTVRDGKIVKGRIYATHAEALAAAGLDDQGDT